MKSDCGDHKLNQVVLQCLMCSFCLNRLIRPSVHRKCVAIDLMHVFFSIVIRKENSNHSLIILIVLPPCYFNSPIHSCLKRFTLEFPQLMHSIDALITLIHLLGHRADQTE
jgi:hypothetical protein